jgi:hypothetical protein
MSGKAPWSFVDYACGHSAPVRGGDRTVDRTCPDCAKQALLTHDPYYCAECAELDWSHPYER